MAAFGMVRLTAQKRTVLYKERLVWDNSATRDHSTCNGLPLGVICGGVGRTLTNVTALTTAPTTGRTARTQANVRPASRRTVGGTIGARARACVIDHSGVEVIRDTLSLVSRYEWSSALCVVRIMMLTLLVLLFDGRPDLPPSGLFSIGF